MICVRAVVSCDGAPLAVRVSAPEAGGALPVVIFSHGHGFSGDDYQPLAEHWAANGFVVIQPTHADARVLDDAYGGPERPADVWLQRIRELGWLVDHLDEVAALSPALAGSFDGLKIIVAGHSFGAHTAQALMGARIGDGQGGWLSFRHAKVAGAILLCAPGAAGDLSPAWADRSYLQVDWREMAGPVLVVAGDRDDPGVMSGRGWDWRCDPYALAAPGGKHLLVLAGAGHYLGGALGEPRPPEGHTPAILNSLKAAVLAFARAAVDPAAAWPAAAARPAGLPHPVLTYDSK
jgi:dienelactone hydrolase